MEDTQLDEMRVWEDRGTVTAEDMALAEKGEDRSTQRELQLRQEVLQKKKQEKSESEKLKEKIASLEDQLKNEKKRPASTALPTTHVKNDPYVKKDPYAYKKDPNALPPPSSLGLPSQREPLRRVKTEPELRPVKRERMSVYADRGTSQRKKFTNTKSTAIDLDSD